MLETSFHCEGRTRIAGAGGVVNGKLLKGRGILVGVGGIWHSGAKSVRSFLTLLIRISLG